MSTIEENAAGPLAAQALGFATIEMLLKLGHSDTLDLVKSKALEIFIASVPDGIPGFDRDKAIEHGRLMVLGMVEAAKAKAQLENRLRQ